MMSHDQWLNRIVEVVGEIASKKFQEDAWLLGHPSTSSPTEMYNQLFDDYTFDLFFDTYSKSFTPDQKAAWSDLRRRLIRFSDRYPEFPNERVVFDDPDWQMVREAAGKFVTAFEPKALGTSRHAS